MLLRCLKYPKNGTYALCLFVLLISFLNQGYSQRDVEFNLWKEDINYLRKEVNQNFPFLFKKTKREDWNKIVDSLLAEIKGLENHQILFGLAKAVSAFGYGHTEIEYNKQEIDLHRVPLNLYYFNDGIYIEGVKPKFSRALGCKVISIENVPIDEVLDKIRPIVPVENEQYFKAYGLIYLTIPEVLHAQGITSTLKRTITFKLLTSNHVTIEVSFGSEKWSNTQNNVRYGHTKFDGEWMPVQNSTVPLYLRYMNEPYDFEYIESLKTVYVRQSEIGDGPKETMDAFYQRIFEFIDTNDVKRFILDLRLNGGGNNRKNQIIIKNILQTPKINIRGKFYAIIGRRTFSACQNLVNELEKYTNVLFVGEPTAENVNFFGDTYPLRLPNSGIIVNLSFAWWQDKPDWEYAPWTFPHLPVELTFEQFKAGKDPYLSKALKYKYQEGDFIFNPMETLQSLFLSGDMRGLREMLLNLIEDQRFQHFDFQNRLEIAGLNLINSKRYKQGILVFRIILEIFPETAKSWYNLAFAHYLSKDDDLAIKALQEAGEIDKTYPGLSILKARILRNQ
ncbi:hypothetical protein DX873_17275 [Flagellimonas nanhaiensis]|uniref:Uncharacterized protein n=1 Tax=Flagellimonas nanhaiensis TaxID=2292706 RepID=A0A371JLM4_9FLAO|nr:hypothetical protein DX873_17275 [Allomuricauda nanhaiensis]